MISPQQFLGNTALFIGVESQHWQVADFVAAATFAAAHRIDTLFIKVFDGPNEWYNGNFSPIYDAVSAIMMRPPVPYGYLYGYAKGSDLPTELALVQKYMNAYGGCIGNLEVEWDNNPVRVSDNKSWSVILHDTLIANPNYFYASVLADPLQQNQVAMFLTMAPAVNGWMPEVYDDFLQTLVLAQFSQIGLTNLAPTIDISQEFGANNVVSIAASYQNKGNLSLWEYGLAQANPALIDAVVSTRKGSLPMIYAEVAHFPDVSQMEPGESEFACGFFAVGECLYAGQFSVGGTPEQVDTWVDAHGGVNTQGVSIDDMHNLLKAANLPYWDIDGISPTSAQSSDIASIMAASKHKYAVICTVAEDSVDDLDLGGNPYAPNWTPSGNHVITCTGISPDGNLLFHDTASIVGGIFGRIASQPRRYRASSINISWATVVIPGLKPWLPAIQSGSPTTWKDVTMGVPTGWKDDGVTLTAPNGVSVMQGFREFVLNHTWDSGNWPLTQATAMNPLEQSNPKWGAGNQQMFIGNNGPSMLGWRQIDNLVVPEFTGPEIVFLRKTQDTLTAQNANQASQITSQNTTIIALRAQIAALQAASSGIPQVVVDDVKALIAAVGKLTTDIEPPTGVTP